MNMWPGRLILAMAVASSSLVFAESADLAEIPPPRPPWVAAPPEKAAWTITVTEKPRQEDKKEAVPAPKKLGVAGIQSVKDGELKRDIITYDSGAKSEVWYYRNHTLAGSAANPARIIVQSLSALNDPLETKGVFRELGNPVRSAGFPGVGWLDKRHYEGVVLFDKKTPSYYYALRGKDPETGEPLIAAEAWINAETGRPVAYSMDGRIYLYNFGEASGEKLALPASFATAYEKLLRTQARQKRLEADAAALQ
jgi:hypothetical protein